MSVDLSELEETASDGSWELTRGGEQKICQNLKQVTSASSTDRHLGVIGPLVRSNADCSLDRALDVALLRIHLHELEPGLDGVSWAVQTALVGLLRLLFMVQPRAKFPQDLPLLARFAICDMLGLEVSDFGAENSPHAEVLW